MKYAVLLQRGMHTDLSPTLMSASSQDGVRAIQ